jgi:RpiB/LacA/LacB family sugar-phosphate isomerase
MYLGADHGGFALKEYVKNWLTVQTALFDGVIEDIGAQTLDPEDSYVPYAREVAQLIQKDSGEPESEQKNFGILVCRSGGGMCIAANRYERVRAVVCRNRADVIHSREHNNANILVLEGDRVTPVQAEEMVRVFLQTAFGEGRHVSRVRAIDEKRKE